MQEVAQIGPANKKQEVVATCGVVYACLSVAWYATNDEEDKAKELVQLLLTTVLSDEDIPITARQRKLLEEAEPFSVLS